MLLFQNKYQKQLNELLNRIQMNFENNYKDAAQMNLKEYEERLIELINDNKIKGSGKQYYEDKLNYYKEQMKRFTHKDQKPKW